MFNILIIITLMSNTIFGGVGMEITTDSGLKYTDQKNTLLWIRTGIRLI